MSLTPLAKAIRPLPDKWHGLSDEDMRYRQREVDLLANPDSRRVFDVRFKTLASMRQTFTDEGFVEVETPILQSLAGGAIARPFVTHSNALDIDLSLRIAPELFLKRLVVGGYERVFEIARNFRNEGIDTRHSPEFTLLEAYRAFGDVHDGLDLTERAIVTAARAAVGRLTFTVGDRKVDLTPPWPRHELLDLLEDAVGRRLHPSDPVEEVRAVSAAHDVPFLESWGSGKLIFEMYDKILQRQVLDPQFICGFPVEVSPLARHRPDDPTLADRFEARDRRQGAGQRLQRAERARRAGGSVRGHDSGGGVGRRGGASGGPGVRPRPRVRSAPHFGHRHRDRPPGDAAGRGYVHPRRNPFSILRPEATE